MIIFGGRHLWEASACPPFLEDALPQIFQNGWPPGCCVVRMSSCMYGAHSARFTNILFSGPAHFAKHGQQVARREPPNDCALRTSNHTKQVTLPPRVTTLLPTIGWSMAPVMRLAYEHLWQASTCPSVASEHMPVWPSEHMPVCGQRAHARLA